MEMRRFFSTCVMTGISLQFDRTSSREAIRQQIGMAICIGFIRVDVSCCSHRQTQSLRLSLQLNFQLISLYIAASGEREYHKRCKLHIKFVHFLLVLQKFSLNISKFLRFLISSLEPLVLWELQSMINYSRILLGAKQSEET